MNIDRIKLINALNEIHPNYAEGVNEKKAEDLINNLDNSLIEPLYAYLENNEKKDYTHGEFSLYLLHNGLNYSYIESIELLNEYIKNPLSGKAEILRRK